MDKVRSITLLLGKTGQGKSHFRRKLTEKTPRLFVFDPVMEDESVHYYGTGEELLDAFYNEDFNTGRKFRVGVHDPDLLDTLATCAYIVGECTIVVEECSIAFPSTTKISNAWRENIFLGRHRAVSIILTAQRAISVPIAVRSQATRCVSYAQHEDRDVDWLRAYFGNRTNEIPELEEHECLESEKGVIYRYKVAK